MPRRQTVTISVLSVSILFQASCSVPARSSHSETPRAVETQTQPPVSTAVAPPPTHAPAQTVKPSPTHAPAQTVKPLPTGRSYPLHTGIVATTFWVGEIFQPNSPDGSQVISTYDAHWLQHYGGCDGVVTGSGCQTEARVAANGFFPARMTPRENPFYLDLPFDDVNNAAAFAQRAKVIPWANAPGYAGHAHDPAFSYMKNRWVKLMRNGKVCYGQIEDAGPGDYDDYQYVFGTGNRRPASSLYNGAGLDVSPALTGCLGFTELNGDDDRVSWQFVDGGNVPSGPWTRLVTTQGISE